jgi:nuclear transport factor 2 (NTF2) superfamily protein
MKNLWEKIKKWAKETALPWLKKAWIQIVNVIIVLFAYGQLDNAGLAVAAAIVGFWGFILLGYWIFWKFLGADKAVKALIAQKKRKK